MTQPPEATDKLVDGMCRAQLPDFPWERTDRVDALRAAAGL